MSIGARPESSRVAIVSGAARGLGKAFALRLAESGYSVLAFDIDKAVMELPVAATMVADQSLRTDVEKVIEAALLLGTINVLVNNAGKWKVSPVTSDWQTTLNDWDEIMDTNLLGVMMLSRAAVPHMKPGGGHIINISSYYVLPARSDGTNPPDTDLYNASKWALNGFTDAWSKRLEADGIAVNGLCMGAVDTPMLRNLFPGGELPPSFAQQVMQPEEIADQMLALMVSGRTGENVGAWVGEPITIGEQPALHKRITG